MKRKIVFAVFCLAAFLSGIFVRPLRALAFEPAVDEDYILRMEKPEPGHYFAFVNEEGNSYTVQKGDTLWKIAGKYYGDGAAYPKIWEKNKEKVSTPETLQIGTELKIPERLYTGAGMLDDSDDRVIASGYLRWRNAWEWDPESYGKRYHFGYDYELFPFDVYPNEIGEVDPYRNWEDFQEEIRACSRRLCGDRVSDLTFAKYQAKGFHVPEGCRLCYYRFTFEGTEKKYVVMVSFAYTDTMQAEGFAVCDEERCSETEMAEAQGKMFYKLIRSMLDGGPLNDKTADYGGADEWAYPQLRNPFTQAMNSFCANEPLEQVTDFPGDYALTWKDAAMEGLVREELTKLWQLTETEQENFAGRPVMAGDLAAVKGLWLEADYAKREITMRLNGNNQNHEASVWKAELTTLADLRNFSAVKTAVICLRRSPIKDFSSLGELDDLQELEFDLMGMQVEIANEDMAFLGKLENLRLLNLYGWDEYGATGYVFERTKTYEGVTDLSVLQNCPRLAYLCLNAGNVESYDFLGNLPELSYLCLWEHPDMKNAKPDRTLLPDGCVVTIKEYREYKTHADE